MARAKNETRDQRISVEAIVDAHDSSERAMGWYYYLEGKMRFPFKAPCRLARPISVLRVKEEVRVLGMAPEEGCETEMFVGSASWRASCRPVRASATAVERRGDPGSRQRLALLDRSRVRE